MKLDNFFTDWSVLDKIHSSQQAIEDTKNSVKELMDSLLEKRAACVRNSGELEDTLEGLINA